MSGGGITKGFYWAMGPADADRIHLDIVWRADCKVRYIFPKKERFGGLFQCFARLMNFASPAGSLQFTFGGGVLHNEDTPETRGVADGCQILCTQIGRPTTRSVWNGGLTWENGAPQGRFIISFGDFLSLAFIVPRDMPLQDVFQYFAVVILSSPRGNYSFWRDAHLLDDMQSFASSNMTPGDVILCTRNRPQKVHVAYIVPRRNTAIHSLSFGCGPLQA